MRSIWYDPLPRLHNPQSSPVLVCLHGWGGSKESFTELREELKNDPITILTPDLPGFGDEPEPLKAWTNDDYADWVGSWLHSQLPADRYPLHAIFLLGHSHGGRIALKLATRESRLANRFVINHLFLCAPAGIRHARHFKRILGLMLAKVGSTLLSLPGLSALAPLGKKLLYKLVRVHDYEHASDIMRSTLIHVSHEDLRPLLGSITVPTDIFWGKDDGMTPYSDALIMERELKGSTLHSYDGVRHRVHRDKAKEIAEVIRGKIEK